MDPQNVGFDVFFLLVGAILVFAMHGGFAFLEMGTVRHKNQVNALVKIMVDADMRAAGLTAIGEGDEILRTKFPERWWAVD